MSGDTWMYLNSDDLLMPGALATVAELFADRSIMWVAGACDIFDTSGIIGDVRPGPAGRTKDYLAPWSRSSQHVFPFSGACYFRREVVDQIGLFDESYKYSMDIEYCCRAVFEGDGLRQTTVPNVLARWRWHTESKTVSRGIAYAFRAEEVRIAERYAHHLPPADRAELEAEIRRQLKWLPVRESMWLLGEKRSQDALFLLFRSAGTTPSLFLSRPWFGAVRRAILQLPIFS
jgi:GT2 family glycosyltransferase